MENVFNDLVNDSIKASFDAEQKAINDNQNLIIKHIRQNLGRKYAKQAIKTKDGVYIGPYKFKCVCQNLWESYYLAYVSESGENIRINSLSDFGDYIKQNNQSETYS